MTVVHGSTGERVAPRDLLTGQIVDILRSGTCHRCGGYKRPGMAHCGSCYARLPQEMKTELWKRVGEGYERAYVDSLLWLEEHPAG
jgi:hypothetical protein